MTRFDGLFSQRKRQRDSDEQAPEHLDVETSKHLDVQAKLAKSKDPNYQRSTIYLPKELHQKLKLAAISEGKEISQVVEELIKDWLEQLDV